MRVKLNMCTLIPHVKGRANSDEWRLFVSMLKAWFKGQDQLKILFWGFILVIPIQTIILSVQFVRRTLLNMHTVLAKIKKGVKHVI